MSHNRGLQYNPVKVTGVTDAKLRETLQAMDGNIQGLFAFIKGLVETSPGKGVARVREFRPHELPADPRFTARWGRPGDFGRFGDNLFRKLGETESEDRNWSKENPGYCCLQFAANSPDLTSAFQQLKFGEVEEAAVLPFDVRLRGIACRFKVATVTAAGPVYLIAHKNGTAAFNTSMTISSTGTYTMTHFIENDDDLAASNYPVLAEAGDYMNVDMNDGGGSFVGTLDHAAATLIVERE